MGLLQDLHLWSGLKSIIQAFLAKLRIVGSRLSVVNIGAFFTRNAVALPVLFALIFLPFQAEASVFSFISSLFSGQKVEAEEVSPNSQNMQLLEARISPMSDATSTDGDLSIVGGTSLSSETQVISDAKTAEDDQISIYVVHSGDTLPAIAKMFGVSTNTIRWANDISGNTIKVGQTLVILPISGIKHVVKSGDTIQSIAKLHKGDVDEILQYNNLTKGAKLSVGDVIIVPDGEAVPTPTYSTSGVVKSSGKPVYDGYYMRPIIGGVKTQGVHGHNGVDLASSYGANILAAADGQVIIARGSGWNGGYGSYIVVKHDNGTQTLYAHLSGVNVSVGQNVSQGQVIGYMGRSGQVTGHTGVHLHFEIRGARNPF